MISDPSLFVKRIRYLSQALIISGSMNILILTLFVYWALTEHSPTPYCELKPAETEQQQAPLADYRGNSEILSHLSTSSFSHLVNLLKDTQPIENGLTQRDLSLTSLVSFHFLDLVRALKGQPAEERQFAWKLPNSQAPIILTLYPNLTNSQFESIIEFTKTEQWPFTPKGLFLLLQKNRKEKKEERSLEQAFMHAPEFWTVELLFKRSSLKIPQEEILNILLEGNWDMLDQFVKQQKKNHDQSAARRQKFLLDYIVALSPSAAKLMLRTDWDLSVKKLDNTQVITTLQLLPKESKEGKVFAKEMLKSPRSLNVWKEASKWLYSEAGEQFPDQWDYQKALTRFTSDPLELRQKKIQNTKTVEMKNLPLRHDPNNIKDGAPSKNETPISLKQNNSKKIVQNKKSFPFIHQKLPKKSSAPIFYVVQDGDSLWKISKKFQVNVAQLKDLNGMQSDRIKPGMILRVPTNS